MAFTVSHYHDFLALPAIVRDLVEAQKRTEEGVEQLARAQERTHRGAADQAGDSGRRTGRGAYFHRRS